MGRFTASKLGRPVVSIVANKSKPNQMRSNSKRARSNIVTNGIYPNKKNKRGRFISSELGICPSSPSLPIEA